MLNEEWIGDGYAQAKDHSHNGTDSALISGSNVGLSSFSYLTERSYSAGDDLLISSDTETTPPNSVTTPQLIKEVRLSDLVKTSPGSALRIKFDSKSSNAGTWAHGRIYRNGSPVGTLRSHTTTSYVTYSEDISGWDASDLVQLYGYNDNGGATLSIKNFRIYVADDTTNYINRVTKGAY